MGERGRAPKPGKAEVTLRLDVDSLHRFVAKITESDDEGRSCWMWSGAVGSDGYGRVRRRGQSYSAHRYAYELFKGPIPEDLCVMHRCDTPLCVNPSHLVLGTRTDNMQDMLSKGRHGDSSPKLSFAQVTEIRRMLASGASKTEVCEQFGICRSTVQDIENGSSWAEHPLQGWLF